MIKVAQINVRYECSKCGSGFSDKRNITPTEVTSLQDIHIKGQRRTNCWNCHNSEVDIREIVGILAGHVPYKFEVSWECPECSTYWVEYRDVTYEQLHKDKDLPMKLMEGALCPNPYCKEEKYHMSRFEEVD